MGKLINICFNIGVSLTNKDCSYAKTRVATTAQWRGPIEGSSFYPIGSTGDNINYVPVPNDGKLAMPLSGTVTIDDNGTPADGSDDKISATWIFGAAASNASTGNGDRAVERWDSWTHTLAPTTVDFATAQGGGGFEYVIGSRGKPTPAPLFITGNASDTFPSENAKGTLEAGQWDNTAITTITNIADRIGIEKTRGFGNGGPGLFTPNVGANTTAVFGNYTCEDNAGDTDCVNAVPDPTKTTSAALFGPNRNGGGEGAPNWSAPYDGSAPDRISGDPNAVPLGPGFSNVILIVTTNGANAITSAEAYWTREYIIAAGPTIADDDDVGGPGSYLTNNSWGGGRFTFTGSLCQDTPVAVDDPGIAVIENTATQVAVLNNDTCGTEPNTIEIVTQPAHGTATPSGSGVLYTPASNYSGADTFVYRIVDATPDTSNNATVTLAVSEKVPVAGNFNGSSSGGNPSVAINVLGGTTQLGTGTAVEHTVTPGAGTFGTCAAGSTAGTLVFTPTPGAGNGSGGCTFTITDADGDSDDGQLTISVSGNGGSSGGVSGPQLPSGGGSLDLLTLGALLAGLPLIARRRRPSR
jgi:hypothetical protein